jgi:DNA helicase-2/ATP-dependent DNA helicase PcrA
VKYGGLKFLEAAHVKDALCFLRLAENPKDTTSAHRVLQLLDGFGPAHTRRAIDFLADHKFDLKAWPGFNPPPAAADQWRAFTDLLLALTGIAKRETLNVELDWRQLDVQRSSFTVQRSIPSLPDQIAAIRAFYQPILEKRYDQSQVRARDLEQLQQISSNFPSRCDLLTDLTLDPPTNTQDLAGPPLFEEDYLILSTIHSAKGCEWDAVYVMHAADGNIPSDMSTGHEEEIEEERRLFYVALTRAKDFLEVLFPLKYYHKKHRTGDAHSYAQLTRFLPESILNHFERVTLQPKPQLDLAARVKPQSDIKQKIAAMWT